MKQSSNRRVVPGWLSSILLLALFTVADLSLAVSREIVRGRAICDQTETACIDGVITWYKNDKTIKIEGRLRRAVTPGKLHFLFSGHLSTGEQVFHTQQVELRGKRGEIIDERFKPPFSNQTIWALHQLRYEPLVE